MYVLILDSVILRVVAPSSVRATSVPVTVPTSGCDCIVGMYIFIDTTFYYNLISYKNSLQLCISSPALVLYSGVLPIVIPVSPGNVPPSLQ